MGVSEDLEEARNEIAKLRQDFGRLSMSMAQSMKIWSDVVQQNADDHTRFAEAIHALAMQAEVLTAQFERLAKGSMDA